MKKQTEHQMQCEVIRWSRSAAALRPCLAWLHAIPNGGARDARTGAMLKAEGVTPGVADLFLPWPVEWVFPNYDDNSYHGLYIEMKTAKGRLTKDQKAFRKYAEGAGYRFEVCRSAAEAIKVLEEYLGL